MNLKEINWLLVIAAVILAAGLLRGYLQGALRILCTTIGLVVGIVISIWGGPLVSSALQNTKMADRLEQSIEKTLKEEMELKVLSSENIEKSLEEDLHIPGIIAKKIADLDALQGVTKKSKCFDTISNELTSWVMKVVFMAVITLALAVLCLAVGLLSGILNKIPILGTANRLIGALVCGGESMLIIWVFFAVLAISVTGRLNALFMPNIEDSAFLTFLFENNPLLSLWGRG